MRRYGNVAGFIYRAQQQEAQKPDPPEPEPEPEPEPVKDECSGMTKACRMCGKELPLESFYKNKTGALGRCAYCKACEYARHKYVRDRAKRMKEKEQANG